MLTRANVLRSKETLLLEPEKSAPCIETLEPEKVDEEEEGKKDESSCSSEEEEDEDSESETEPGILLFVKNKSTESYTQPKSDRSRTFCPTVWKTKTAP